MSAETQGHTDVVLRRKGTLIVCGVLAAFFGGIVVLGLVTTGEAPVWATALLVAVVLAGAIDIAVPRPERAMAFILIPFGAFLILVSGVLWFEEALTDERRYYEFVLGPGIGLAANYVLILMLSYSAQPGEAGGPAVTPSQDE